jgi:hypothetical protein
VRPAPLLRPIVLLAHRPHPPETAAAAEPPRAEPPRAEPPRAEPPGAGRACAGDCAGRTRFTSSPATGGPGQGGRRVGNGTGFVTRPGWGRRVRPGGRHSQGVPAAAAQPSVPYRTFAGLVSAGFGHPSSHGRPIRG